VERHPPAHLTGRSGGVGLKVGCEHRKRRSIGAELTPQLSADALEARIVEVGRFDSVCCRDLETAPQIADVTRVVACRNFQQSAKRARQSRLPVCGSART
jgi:hypothetical protein